MLPASFWLIAAVDVLAGIMTAFYAAGPIEPVPLVPAGVLLLPLLTCLFWVERDARRHNVFFPTDWGLYALVAWPLLIPWYAWRTRRRARWRVILGLYGAMLAPYVIAMWALLLYHALAKQRAVPDRAPEEGHVTLVLPPLS